MWATFKRVGLSLLMAAGIAALLAGCFGLTQNPSYFPRILPTGDIVRTHAKPPGWGYFTNFDPKAVRLEVRPIESTNPVQTQHVILATIYDEHGKPRRKRRVEWMLEGVGNIVEVDESGYFPGRGYKVDNKYAVSYTDYKEHKITRGTATRRMTSWFGQGRPGASSRRRSRATRTSRHTLRKLPTGIITRFS